MKRRFQMQGKFQRKHFGTDKKRLSYKSLVLWNGESDDEKEFPTSQELYSSSEPPPIRPSLNKAAFAEDEEKSIPSYVHSPESKYDQGRQDQFLRKLIEMRLHTLSFPAFQQLVRQVLVLSGYTSVRTCGEGKDRKTWGEGGLELLAFAHTDLSTSLTAVQLKLHRQPVPRRCVDELRGVMERVRADAGLMVSVAPFSALTRKLAARSDLPPVQLIDSKRLTQMLLQLRLGICSIQQQGSSEVRYVYDAAFFDELEAWSKGGEDNTSEATAL